jgi:hypothetical protein
MPRTIAAGYDAVSAKQGGLAAPIWTADIVLPDGTAYYFTDFEGTYPRVSDSADQSYEVWIKQAGPIRRSRDSRTDAGDLVLQNLSGNTIERDLAQRMKAKEFEGALCILRSWDALHKLAVDRFDGYLTEQDGNEEQFMFRVAQLLDAQQYDVADDPYAETCTLRFRNDRCASTGVNTICTKRFVPSGAGPNDCTALERFNGSPNPAPNNLYQIITQTPERIGGGGGGRQPRDPRMPRLE